jgi:N-acetylglutamate synthase
VRARYEVRIGHADVGQRVSVRARIPAAPGEPSTTDTLGILRSWEDGVLRIERRDGTTVEIEEGDLLAGKLIPPPPVRRRNGSG